MKRFISIIICIFCLMIPLSARAEITWGTTEFDYSIENLSAFYYYTNQYYQPYNQYIRESDSDYSSYDSVAEIHVLEFQNIPSQGSGIQIDAMSMGPENGVDPPDGIMVQAFLGTVAQGLNGLQGADIDLEGLSRIVRRFTVNQQDDYTIQMDMAGLVDFDGFYSSDYYLANYAIEAEIVLEKTVVVGDGIVVTTMPGFPVYLSESVPSASVEAQLQSVDDQMRPITYRIKCQLTLTSRILNMNLFSGNVYGDVNGNYNLGSSESPFTIEVSLLTGSSDADQDGIPDAQDNCPDNSNPDQLDDDEDGTGNVCDGCPDDPLKTVPGICGCGTMDVDSDDDGVMDCQDLCPSDPDKAAPGICGCGVLDIDSDSDGTMDCVDLDDDNDGLNDDMEATYGTDPLDKDSDDDGMPDGWEVQYELDPLNNDASYDEDDDGWSNYLEFKRDTDPTDPESYPKKTNIAPIIELLLSQDDSEDPGGGEVACSEYMTDGCHVPPPSGLTAGIETIPEGIYVNFSWNSADCADGYLIAIGTSSNLIADPSTVVIPCTMTSFRANFSLAEEGNYYWAVSSRCNRFTSEAGDFSAVKLFEFNL